MSCNYVLDTIQDFLCKLGMKPRIIMLSLKHVIIRPTKIIKDLCSQYIDRIYVLDLQRSLIILVGLAMTCFSEEMMISYSCRRGFMPNLHKKS